MQSPITFTRGLYKPYTGGAGPSEAQVSDNNVAIGEVLFALGIAYHATNLDAAWGIETLVEVPVLQFMIGEDVYTIGYDRWGYVTEGDKNIDLDQADIDTVIMRLMDLMLLEGTFEEQLMRPVGSRLAVILGRGGDGYFSKKEEETFNLLDEFINDEGCSLFERARAVLHYDMLMGAEEPTIAVWCNYNLQEIVDAYIEDTADCSC